MTDREDIKCITQLKEIIMVVPPLESVFVTKIINDDMTGKKSEKKKKWVAEERNEMMRR